MINRNILNFVKFATDNNPIGLANSMFDEKITVREGRDTDMVSRLYKLFENDRVKFILVMRNAGYNSNAKNYTTEPNMLSKLANSLAEYKAGKPTEPVLREEVSTSLAREWWNELLDTLVGGGTTDISGTTTTTEPAMGQQTKVIMVSLLAIGGIVALVYFLTK